jgi:hypothetical protein
MRSEGPLDNTKAGENGDGRSFLSQFAQVNLFDRERAPFSTRREMGES